MRPDSACIGCWLSSSESDGSALRGDHIEGNVDDHVLLAPDHAPAAELNKNLTRIDAIVRSSLLGMAQEAGVDAGIAERERFPVNANRPILERTDQLLGGVHQLVE